MPIRKIRNFETPEGFRQSQITEFFSSTGPSTIRRQIEFASRSKMLKKFINNNSDDDFDDPTPKKMITLPHPILSDDEKNILHTPKIERKVRKHRRTRELRKQLLETSLNSSNLAVDSSTQSSCISPEPISKQSLRSLEYTARIMQSQAKISDNLSIASSINDEFYNVSSTSIDTENTSTQNSYLVSAGGNHLSDLTDCETPKKKAKPSIFAATPSKSRYNSLIKSSSKVERIVSKNSPTSNKTAGSPNSQNRIPSSKVNTSLKLDEEESKLNFTQMDVLKKLFSETLEDESKKMLLTAPEVDVIEGFLEMDEFYQYFLMKLFTFQPLWYNMLKFCTTIKLDQKLSSKEMTNMYEYHKSNIYIKTDPSDLSLDELLDMLMVADLKLIVKTLKLKRDTKREKTKADLIQCLYKHSRTQPTLTKQKSSTDILRDAALKHLGCCIKLKDDVRTSFHKAYILQTFSNSSYCTDIQTFIKDKGYMKIQYPKYKTDSFTPFEAREEFTRFYEAIVMKIDYGVALEKNDMPTLKEICDQAFEKIKNIDDDAKWKRNLPSYLHKFSAEYQYISILNGSIKKLSKHHEDVKTWLEYLIENYPTNRAIGFWYKHLAHLTVQYDKNYEYAAQIVIKAYEFDKRENVFDFLQIFELNKLAHKIRTTKSYKVCTLYCDELTILSAITVDSENFPKKFIKACTDRRETPGKRIYSFRDANDDVSYGSVEMIALNHYSENEGYDGIHCEGQLIILLYTLLFWDIIYEYHVPNTFISELQNAPLDMYSSSFYENRKEAIQLRLKEISSEWSIQHLRETIKNNWENHSEERSIIDFENIKKDVDDILKIVCCFNRIVLSEILGRLATNYRRFRSGLPDLFLWNTEKSKCKFVEVKGEKDKLQPNQILWIQHLFDVGAVVEVCHVSGVGAKES